jgi:hypothetical protein
MFIFSWLAKLGIGSIIGQLTHAYEARENAKTNRQVIAADERIKGLQARRDVMIAESNTPINSIIRALFALPVAVYYGKIFLWDKVLALGATDALSADLLHVSWVIIGFYFLTEATTKIARKR